MNVVDISLCKSEPFHWCALMVVSFEPPDKQTVKKEFEAKTLLYEQLALEVEYILRKAISRKKIILSDISKRVKEFKSFYNKILRKEISENPFEKIEDLAGVRVICLYRSDLEKIQKIIEENFNVIKAETIRKGRENTFGYLSDHYIVGLPQYFYGERYDFIKNLKCEIQVRTVAMHSWATVSHHLDYKQEIDIPLDLRADFNALSGVFYIADSLFDQFRKAREKTIEILLKGINKNKFDFNTELNIDTLKAYLSWKFPKKKLFLIEESLSLLMSRMETGKITDYKQLNEVIDNNLLSYSDSKIETRSAVGIANMILREKVLNKNQV